MSLGGSIVAEGSIVAGVIMLREVLLMLANGRFTNAGCLEIYCYWWGSIVAVVDLLLLGEVVFCCRCLLLMGGSIVDGGTIVDGGVYCCRGSILPLFLLSLTHSIQIT